MTRQTLATRSTAYLKASSALVNGLLFASHDVAWTNQVSLRPLTVQGAPLRRQRPVIGPCIEFGGTATDALSSAESITMPTNWSLSVWLQRPSVVAGIRVFDHNDSTALQWSTSLNSWYFVRKTTGVNGAWNWSDAIPGGTNVPIHICMTQSGAAAPVVLMNGAPVTVSEYIAPTGSAANETAVFYVGNRVTLDRVFQGAIGAVAFWSRALSIGEQASLWNPATRWSLFAPPPRRIYVDVPVTFNPSWALGSNVILGGAAC